MRTRRRAGADDGISLIEVLVATVITTMLLSLVAAMFVQITRATGDGQRTQKATGIASTVMTELAGVIRQGTQVATSSSTTEGAVVGDVGAMCTGATGSTPTCLVIDTYSNVTVASAQSTVPPVRVVFSVDAAGNLVEKRYAATSANGYFVFTPVTVLSSRVVSGPIDVTGTDAKALFVYWNADGNRVVPPATGMTAALAATVSGVTVNVTVANTSARGADPVVLSNRITMPNVAIVNGGS